MDGSAELAEHLFRREAGRLVSALVRALGPAHLPLAEDVVQEALLRALDAWKIRGPPADPSAWLVAVARRCALDRLRRERTARTFAPELQHRLQSEWTLAPAVAEIFEESHIRDGELRTMLTACDPRLPENARVALVLNVLCGFSAREIAAAFLEKEDAVHKRLQRARAALAGAGELVPARTAADVAERLPATQRALYLLFNEGYHGANVEETVRTELCEDAMRLCAILADHEVAGTPSTRALLAMMCLHAARLPARMREGELVPLEEQDRGLWRHDRVQQGMALLEASAEGELTTFHLEAAIAAEHALAPSLAATRWGAIVVLYDELLVLAPGPVAALARAIAVGHRDGPAAGIEALGTLPEPARLAGYPFLEAALGDMWLRSGAPARAGPHFEKALALARSPSERRYLARRLAACASDR